MFSPQLLSRPADPKPINLWHPFPQSRRWPTGQTVQRSVLPGDIISISSDGSAHTRFNIFYSESENRLYGNRTPPGYVAFGAPLESYYHCEEHNVGRLYSAIKGVNCRHGDIAHDTNKHAPEKSEPWTK